MLVGNMPPTQGAHMPKKRLIICCDGTWNWPDQKGNPTNVVKMVRAIRPADDHGVPQIVFYDTGVGTGNLLDRIAGGLFGVGLAENVKQTYGFIVDNYQPGDELFLFGFSRGAHTVRSLSGLVGLIGLIPKQHMDEFLSAWAYYRTPPQERTEAQRREFLARFPEDAQPRKTRIDFIGVWDTVGTMGIPTGPLRMIGQRRYRFHVNSRKAKWRLSPAKLRPLCQTDESERIHYTAIERLNATGADYNFDPYPYDCLNLRDLMTARGTAFQALIDRD
jgi:uncharacterized protein (DUF2235 family)